MVTNTQSERPCYCSSLPGSKCDFCTGLASLDGERAKMWYENRAVKPAEPLWTAAERNSPSLGFDGMSGEDAKRARDTVAALIEALEEQLNRPKHHYLGARPEDHEVRCELCRFLERGRALLDRLR